MGFSADFLKQAGMRLDRRNEFPKRATSVTLAPEREVPASVLGPMRRGLAESVEIPRDRKSTRLNSSHTVISYAVFCLKKKNRIVAVEQRVVDAGIARGKRALGEHHGASLPHLQQ